ncbi:MAG: RNA methyltransferase [Bacteroidales bacterium]|nr:RNA methyltransferase [Bacteroidales bacterium]MBN2750586.1 RNA methyltransferase [Bacteroidales bacterium]
MLSKNAIKRVGALRIKKHRKETNQFIAEGEKLVQDLAQSGVRVRTIYHTERWIPTNNFKGAEVELISDQEMKKISGLTTPTPVLAIADTPQRSYNETELTQSLSIALDDIQDPGNLGTIIRLTDWFGFDFLLCSKGTVDAFSPKVVQASMGSVARVKIIEVDLPQLVSDLAQKGVPIYGTFLNGTDIYKETLTQNGIVIMGNEGNGISREIEKLVNKKLYIPTFAKGDLTSESLNVAMATAIICSEFRRR